MAYARVCSKHFISDKEFTQGHLNAIPTIGKPSALYDSTNPDWAPSLHLGGAKEPKKDLAISRYDRIVERETKRKKLDDITDVVTDVAAVVVADVVTNALRSVSKVLLSNRFNCN